MSGKKQLRLADYKRQAYISKNELLGGCYAYCLDGHPDNRGGKYDMAQHVGLASCKCCDCFIVEERAVSLIEIKRLLDKKKSVKKKYPYIPLCREAEFFKKFIIQDSTLKLYGSMAVLSRFALSCSDADRLQVDKKYKLWLVAHCPRTAKKDAQALDILLKALRRAFKELNLGFLVEASVLMPEHLQERIKKAAVFS